ncbi:MAG: lysylphosphatidylglycerol synthase transmembrane domain-containing protein [Cytophagales bacterium]|nr:lysylphosphatidylglycerol synthase transmembrane domain-containing protein [Cytophagales bacterium]
MLKSAIKYIISIGVAAALLWFLFAKIDIMSMVAQFAQLNYGVIALSILLSALSHYVRAWRWSLLLHSLGHKVSNISAYHGVVIGYLANLVLPRMGEVTRCGILYKSNKVPVEQSLGTVLSERLIDVLMLGVVSMLCLVIEFDKVSSFFGQYFSGSGVFSNGWVIIILSVLLIMMVSAGIYYWQNKEKINARYPIISKIYLVLIGFVNGAMSALRVKNIAEFMLSTLLLWILYYLVVYVTFYSYSTNTDTTPGMVLVTLMVGTLGFSAPVQGGLGAYHLFVSAVLVMYGYGNQDALFMATVQNTTQLVTFIATGTVSLIIMAWYNKNIK